MAKPPNKYGGMVVPIVCERCGAAKRNALGQLVYVGISWIKEYRKGREMLCPTCYDGLKAMETLADMVIGWDTDE